MSKKSHVSYMATANVLDPLPAPIRDRFRIVRFPKPTVADLTALLPYLLASLATERGLAPEWIGPLDHEDTEWFVRTCGRHASSNKYAPHGAWSGV